MKKRLIILITVISILVSSTSSYGASVLDLGNLTGQQNILVLETSNGSILIFTLYFQFGILTTYVASGGIIGRDIWLYGSEDIPGLTKESIDMAAHNEVHIHVYEADNITNPSLRHHKIVNGEVGSKLENLNLNLDTGKLYIIVFRDESGTVLEVKKILLSE